jgi:competence protein ComEC
MATVPGPRWIGLPTAALAVVAGAAVPSHLGSLTGAGPWPWLLLLLIAALARRRPAARWLVGALALGAAAAAVRPPPAPATGQVAVRIDQPVWVDGAVQLGPGRWSAPVRDGAGRRWWLVSPAPIAPGDHLQVRGRLIAPGPVRNPGGVDGVALARQRGVEATLAASEVERLGTSPAWPWRWADQQRARWSARIAAVDPGRAGAIVRGAVVGDRSAIPPATDRAWRAAGIYHVLSVSGLHLAVVALLAFALQRRALAALGWPRRWPAARVAAAPTLALATAYTLITGAELATVRALLVVATLVLAEALGRKVRLVDALAAACVLVVVTTPAAVAAPAFQLSFVAAAVLVSLPGAPACPPSPGWRGWLSRRGRWLGRALWASWWVGSATAIITAFHFGELSWGGLVGNVALTPIFELGVIPLALLALVLAPLAPALAGFGLALACDLAGLVDAAAGALAGATPLLVVPRLGPLVVVSAATAWVAGFALSTGRVRARHGGPVVLAACLVLGLVLARERAGAGLTVTFLDVGQGDAAVVELPTGEVWLIDAGGRPGPGNLASQTGPGRVVAAALAARGHDHVDLAIVSHPHPDHYLGLLAVAERTPIHELWVAASAEPAPPCAGPTCWSTVLDRLRAAGTVVRTPPLGLARVGAGVGLTVLAPTYHPTPPALVAAADPVRSVNDNSLVVMVSYRGRRVLFLGDVEEEGELALVDQLGPVEVVKVAHHGSATSSSPALVAAVAARWAVVSVGAGNRFGLPRAGVLARWRQAGATVVRTDEAGAVGVTIDGAGAITVTQPAGP